MSTILVAGGAGYIGSHVVKELLLQGHKPIVFDNIQTGHRKAIADALSIEGDLSDQERTAEIFQANSIDAVMHFAGDCLVVESVQMEPASGTISTSLILPVPISWPSLSWSAKESLRSTIWGMATDIL